MQHQSEDDDQDDNGYCTTSDHDELVTRSLTTIVNYIIVIFVIIVLAQVTYNQVATVIANQSLGKSVFTYLSHNDATMYLKHIIIYNVQIT